MTLELPRRRFLLGLMAAPAIVRAASLMPVRAISPRIGMLRDNQFEWYTAWVRQSLATPNRKWFTLQP